jgi:hypothetical protein
MHVDGEEVSAEAVVAVVKRSIERGNLAPAAEHSNLQVTAVDIELKVVTSRSLGGGLHFRVPVLGADVSMRGKSTRARTQTISITLVPPGIGTGHEIRDGDVEEALVEAVATVRRLMAAAAYGESPWLLGSGMVELEFGVTMSGGLVLGFESDRSDESSNKLKLTLGPGTSS